MVRHSRGTNSSIQVLDFQYLKLREGMWDGGRVGISNQILSLPAPLTLPVASPVVKLNYKPEVSGAWVIPSIQGELPGVPGQGEKVDLGQQMENVWQNMPKA